MRLFAALLIGHEVAAKGNAKSSKVAGSANVPRHANNGVDSAKSFNHGGGLDSPGKKKENGGPRTRTDARHVCMHVPQYWYINDDEGKEFNCEDMINKNICTTEGTEGVGYDGAFYWFDGDYEIDELVVNNMHPLNCPQCGCVEATITPTEYNVCAPDGWEDNAGNTCADHGVKGWCDPWPWYGTWGFNNMHCPECGCVETRNHEQPQEYDECAPADWEDSYGDDCARHGEMDWCNPWPNYAKDGFNNMHCPECGCVEKAVTPSGTWGDWGPFSPCSEPCGPGTKDRYRECKDVDGIVRDDCDESVVGEMGTEVCEDKMCGPNPCPSTECWTHDASTNTCAMNTECATLTCGATAFDVTFKSALFNLDDNQSVVTMAGGVISPVWDGSQWTANTPLGENGMTYAVDANKNEVTFAIKFAIVGDDMKTRSDDVQDNIIDLGTLSVVTTPFGAAVDFSCTYSMTIDVASQEYTVTGASVVDTFSGVGSLAAGFTMTLDNGGSPAFLLGSNMPVAITWSVTALSNLEFYLETCTVIHGTTTIKVVKDGCYSATLGVEATTPVTSAEKGFSYQIFKGVGETDPAQTIRCSVNLCEVGKCNNPTVDNQCPAAGDDATYGYKI